MNAVASLAALGASAVLALVILNQDQPAFRESWESTHGRVRSLAALPDAGQVVPFRLIKDNPVLPILFDGDEHLTCWIVDSGYGYTAVSTAIAQRLKLPHTGKMAVQTLQTDQLNSTRLPSGFVFDMHTMKPVVEIPAHSGVIRDLPNTLDDTYGRNTVCLKQGGILGITFLRHFVTRLDYKNKTLTFYDPSRFQYRPAPGATGQKFTGFLDHEHYFVIPLELDGVTANMALDTGAFATIMTRGFLRKYRQETGRNLDASGVNGSVDASFSETVIELKKKQVGHAFIGDHRLNRLNILFPDCGDGSRAADECPGLLNTNRFDGLLGYSVLKNFVIYMVYEPTPYVILERV